VDAVCLCLGRAYWPAPSSADESYFSPDRTMTKASSPRQRPHFRLRAVPPITSPIGDRAFSGSIILEEYAGVGALILWISFRDAELWSTTCQVGGPLLWADGVEGRRQAVAQLDESGFKSIKSALLTLAELAAPIQPDRASVADGCDSIAGWSEMQNRLGTAVEYAQVASFALPDRAMYAVRAGRVLRMRAEYARALTWFDHGIVVARRTGDWESYAQAYSGLGCLYMQRGNYRRARTVLRRSLRAALRYHLPERSGAAYHNLFAVEASTGNWTLAEQYAEHALATYPEGSRALPRLARDLAFRWIQRGYFDRALPLAREVIGHFAVPADRALVWSDIARAAAGCGEVEIFEDAWAKAYGLATQENVEPFTVDILLNLAHAAGTRNDPVRGTMSARRALELARERKEGQLMLEAEAVLSSIQTRKLVAPPQMPVNGGNVEIADRFVQALQLARATT
jgi:tetratricopeptide (TPR) repeat protein